MLKKKLMDVQRKQELQDAVRKAIITSVLSGKGKFKTPVDMEQLISGGQMPSLNEFQPINTPSTSISITDMPISERMQYRGILGQTPQTLAKDNPEFTRQVDTGELGALGNIRKYFTGSAPGRQQLSFSPEYNEMRREATAKLKSPYKVTKRIGYKGDVMDTAAEDITGEASPETQDAETRFNELVAQGLSEEEAYLQLKNEGF